MPNNLCSPSSKTYEITMIPPKIKIEPVGSDVFEDLVNGGDIKISVEGPAAFTGKVAVSLIPYSGPAYTISVNNGANLSQGTYYAKLDRPRVPVGTYYQVAAKWDTSWNSVTASVIPLDYTFKVLGTIRHSQYNTPAESQCPVATTTAFKIDSNCIFVKITLSTQFSSQVYLNGTGKSKAHGILKYQSARTCPGRYPSGATERNSFRSVSNITGSCNSVISTTSQAVFPNPAISRVEGTSSVKCGNRTVLASSTNEVKFMKAAVDFCPACTDGHIDNWSSSEFCSSGSVGDLGDFWTAIRATKPTAE